jgi:hypothetical protein
MANERETRCFTGHFGNCIDRTGRMEFAMVGAGIMPKNSVGVGIGGKTALALDPLGGM